MTISASRGSSTSMSLRLCSRAPEMTIRSDAATHSDSTQTNRCSLKDRRQFAAVAAGCGVGGVGLVEDSDDGAAEEVAGFGGVEIAVVRIVVARQLAQGPDQALQRRVALAAVEGGEGFGGETGSSKTDAGGDAGGAEVALVVGDGIQRLVLRPACEPRVGQGDGDVGAPGLQFRRLAQGKLVPGGEQLVRPRGDELVEERLDPRRRQRSGELVDDLAVAEDLDVGDSLD